MVDFTLASQVRLYVSFTEQKIVGEDESQVNLEQGQVKNANFIFCSITTKRAIRVLKTHTTTDLFLDQPV